jgi:hypothetical protein
VTVAHSATRWLAEAPSTWQDPPPMSTLHALLLFVGAPALIIALVSLLVIAPSLARGPRYRPGQEWDAQPEWFGGTVEASSSSPNQQLTAGHQPDDSSDQGGASARW